MHAAWGNFRPVPGAMKMSATCTSLPFHHSEGGRGGGGACRYVLQSPTPRCCGLRDPTRLEQNGDAARFAVAGMSPRSVLHDDFRGHGVDCCATITSHILTPTPSTADFYIVVYFSAPPSLGDRRVYETKEVLAVTLDRRAQSRSSPAACGKMLREKSRGGKTC